LLFSDGSLAVQRYIAKSVISLIMVAAADNIKVWEEECRVKDTLLLVYRKMVAFVMLRKKKILLLHYG
jgi:hypothetical protein